MPRGALAFVFALWYNVAVISRDIHRGDASLADKSNFSEFLRGLKNGAPIGLAYLTASMALGLMMHSAGFTVPESIFMSAVLLTGAGEFAAMSLLLRGASNFEIMLTNAILNARYFLQTSTISHRLSPWCPKALRIWLGFTTADEGFSIATIGEKGEIHPYYMLGLNSAGYPCWVAGTALGCYGANAISANLQASMCISLYGMFVGLLVPAMKKSRPVLAVILISAVINIVLRTLPLTRGWNMGWSILISTIVAASFGAYFAPHKEVV